MSEARQLVAGMLAELPATVYPTPVENPTHPSIQIGPGEEWLSAKRVQGGKLDVGITVRIGVPVVAGNTPALELMESLVWSVCGMIPIVGSVRQPRTDTGNQPDVYYAELNTIVTVTEE
jgi:hypothetical protein